MHDEVSKSAGSWQNIMIDTGLIVECYYYIYDVHKRLYYISEVHKKINYSYDVQNLTKQHNDEIVIEHN